MTERLTYEHIKEYIESFGYKLLSEEYVNNNTKLILKDINEYLYTITWSNFQKGYKPNKFSKYNPYTIQNIKLWMKTNAVGYELLSTEFKSAGKDKLLFRCPEGHEFEMYWNSFKQGQRCSVCANRQVLKGYNDIATTDPWMIDLGMSREDAETHTRGSGDKVTVTCPHCGNKKKIIISDIYNYKSICCSCGDGTSYPEKFVMSLLNQLEINYQHDSYWIENKRYDFYLKDYSCVVECHGSQHYRNSTFSYCGGRTLEEEQENDKLKKDLAEKNGFIYIELDCRESKLEYIENSILNSDLSKLVNLSKINWLKCEEFALKNRIKEVCDYWKEHNEINGESLTTSDIANVFNLNKGTIGIYLKKGSKLGWCNYDAKVEMIKSNSNNGTCLGKPVEISKNGKSLGIFESCSELERQSEKLFGVKLNNSKIASVCRGERPHHKGFTFRYVTYEQYKKNKLKTC